MRFTAIDTSAWYRNARLIAQRRRVPNPEHQQTDAPALSGHVRVTLYPNRA